MAKPSSYFYQCLLFISLFFQCFRGEDIIYVGGNENDSERDCGKGVSDTCPPRTSRKDHRYDRDDGHKNSHTNAHDNSNSHKGDNDKFCSLYMAESSIPNAGYGVYTTRDIRPNEPISSMGIDAPSVCVTDVYYHYNRRDPDWAQINYYWSGVGYTSFEAEETSEMVTNVGTLANYHMFLENVDHWAGSYDDDMLDRTKDPGAGAFTYYAGHNFIASKFIQAGDEIFADYGDEWLESRKEAFQDIARRDDYVNAGKILSRFFDGWTNENGKMQELEHDTAHMLKDIISILDIRVASLLPQNLDEMRTFYQSIKDHKNRRRLSIAEAMHETLAYGTTNRRNVTWIEENGLCIDNLTPKRSTLEQAGRGAFARRHLSKGSLVVPVPLLQLMDKEAMNMYALKRDESTMELKRAGDDVIGKQLLLNYCFGHDESSMLLCPGTNAISINHCSDRRDWGGNCGHDKGPNAVVRWASWDKTTEPWLNSTLEDIAIKTQNDERGLSLEIIALRDIEAGEEVFIDYGIQWEKAYLNHLENWRPPKEGSGFESYTSVKKMNEEKGNAPFRTLKEQDDDPYPDNVMTVCYKSFEFEIPEEMGEEIFPYGDEMDEDEAQTRGLKYFGYQNWDRLDIEDVDPSAPNQFITDGTQEIQNEKSEAYGWFVPCQILGRNDDSGVHSYTVRLLHNSGDGDNWVIRRQARILINYPKASIKFATKSYKSDQFLPGAFRHHIGLPVELLPEKWKDVRKK